MPSFGLVICDIVLEILRTLRKQNQSGMVKPMAAWLIILPLPHERSGLGTTYEGVIITMVN